MAAHNTYSCTHCGHELHIAQGLKFRREADGTIKVFPHPEGDVVFKGWVDRLYCPVCGEITYAIIEELDEPIPTRIDISRFCERLRQTKDLSTFYDYRQKPTCIQCGSDSVTAMPNGLECPQCHKGVFKWTRGAIS